MRRAAVISAIVHVVVLVFAFFGLPNLFRPDPPPDQVVAVDLVMVDPKAVVKAVKPPPPKKKPPQKKAKAKPKPPPPPPQTAALPEPVPAPKLKLKPKPKPKPKPKVKVKPKPKPKAKPVPRPKVKPKPPPDRLQALLKNLAKEKREQRKAEKRKTEPPPKKKPAQVAAARTPSVDQSRRAANLGRMVHQMISPCWNIPGGAKDVAEMMVEIRIHLNPDGTLRAAPQVGDARRMLADQVYRAVAESVLRAVRDPRCTPLKLPYAQYDLWRDIKLNFYPGKALGG